MIAHQEYVERMARLRQRVAEAGLETFLVRPSAPAVLLVPALEQQHLRTAPNVSDVHHYWDYPAPAGRGWADRLLELLGRDTLVGVEPSLPQEIAGQLSHLSPRALALVEALRMVKSPAELEMIRHTARYTDLAVRKLLAASYYGVSELELIAQGRAVQLQIMREVGYDLLTSSALVGS